MTEALDRSARVRAGVVRGRPAPPAGSRPLAAPPKASPPRSDAGTIVLHWMLAISVVVSLATGLRLAADQPDSWFAAALSPILPEGEVWTPHFIAAFVALGCMAGYAIYMSAGRLQRRVSLKKAVVLTLPASPKLRWGAVNVLMHWALFAVMLTLAGTGLLLYLGHGGAVVTVHYVAALLVLAYIGLHVVSHTMYGGLAQLLRLFRPQALRLREGSASRPLAVAGIAGAAVIAGSYMVDLGSRDVLEIAPAGEIPRLDGDLSDPAWQSARAVTIRTMQGVNLGGTGESDVEVRAVRDDQNVYFAFRWEDPTLSIKRLPLVKREDGWHMVHDKADLADENVFYEDKLAVTFGRSDSYGSGGSTHMGPKPLADKPGALNGRGLHYTTDGSYMDMWQWKASRGGLLGMLDDMWFGPAVEPSEGQVNGTLRYSAGYDGDGGKKYYVYNYKGEPPGGYRGPVEVLRIPKDWQRTQAKLGQFSLDPLENDDPDGQWWMFDDESVPYDPALDAAIPVGTVMPGVLIEGTYEGSRADVKGAARWADGHWQLETVRALETADAVKDMPMEDGLYMWVAVFDRTQTRHTRHVRPVVIDLQ